MSVKKSLRDLSVALGGSGTATSVDGLISEIAVAKNPLAALKLDVSVAEDEDLLGKVIGDLQTGVTIREGVIYGRVFYQSDYTGFSGDPELQSGYYVVVHATVPNQSGYTISVSKDGGETSKNLDSDGILIFRITNPITQKLVFTATKSPNSPFSRSYSLRGLELVKS